LQTSPTGDDDKPIAISREFEIRIAVAASSFYRRDIPLATFDRLRFVRAVVRLVKPVVIEPGMLSGGVRLCYLFIMASDFKDDLLRIMHEEKEAQEKEAYDDWRKDLLSQSGNLRLRPPEGFEVDIELQPLRWLWRGTALVESRKVTGRVQPARGNEGPELTSYLPYPVFQMATEIFLKGMWLCRFEECRVLTSSSYVDRETREKYLKRLGKNGLGHDLIKIVEEVRQIREYANDAAALKFLDLIERILRRYYFPPYQADKKTSWADARYPKGVYNDITQQSQAEGLESYPPAKWLSKLFREMERDVDRIWSLRAGLSEKIKRSRSKL
jgi:hypothetical protein